MFLLIILLLLAAELQQALQQVQRIPREDGPAHDVQWTPLVSGVLAGTRMDVLGDSPQEVAIVSDISEDQKKEIIDIHNTIRRNVKPTASNMLKMIWSEKARQSAKNWAAKCTGSHGSKEDLIMDGYIHGETIFQSNSPASWSDVMDTWYNTRLDFKYGVGAVDPSKSIAPYTQIIWHRSHKVGCATAYCPNNDFQFFYVCHYYPTGNIKSLMAKPYKEGFPCEECPNTCENKLCSSLCDYVDNSMDCKNTLKMLNCNNKWMMQHCEATCKCATMK